MKERLNNTLQEVELLMQGKIKVLRFYKVHNNEDCWLDDERILDATNYLDGKGFFYTLKDIKDEKHGDGLELKLINDDEEIDCLYEDLNCRIVLDGLNKDEETVLSLHHNNRYMINDELYGFNATDTEAGFTEDKGKKVSVNFTGEQLYRKYIEFLLSI